MPIFKCFFLGSIYLGLFILHTLVTNIKYYCHQTIARRHAIGMTYDYMLNLITWLKECLSDFSTVSFFLLLCILYSLEGSHYAHLTLRSGTVFKNLEIKQNTLICFPVYLPGFFILLCKFIFSSCIIFLQIEVFC